MDIQRRTHFFMVENHVVDSWIKQIGPGGFAVYSLVLRCYNEKKRTTRYHSHQEMAVQLGMSPNTLEKHLKKLTEAGLIKWKTIGKRRHPVRAYVPVLPVPKARD